MPLRNTDKDRWLSELLDAGVDVTSPQVAEKGNTLTVFVFFRLFHVCPSTANFREDKLRKAAHKIVNERSLKTKLPNAEEFEKYEQSEIDLKRIGFTSECFPPSDRPVVPPVDEFYEPAPKISRVSATVEQPPAAEPKNSSRNAIKKARYWQNKYRGAEERLIQFDVMKQDNEELRHQLSEANLFIAKLKSQVTQLEGEIENANSSLSGPSVIPETKKQFKLTELNGSFKGEAMILFAQIAIEFQVAEAKVGTLLEAVANFFDITLDSLPSARTVGRASYVASGVLAEYLATVLERPDVQLTLQSDETTKKFDKLQAFVVAFHNDTTDEIDRLYLEVEAVPNKSSPRQLEALKAVFDDMADKAKRCKATFFDNFILKVKNFMGDQARTQTKFAALCTEYREAVKREIDPHFDSLSEEEQNLFLQTNVLFCFLHLTSNTTPLVFKVLKEDEANEVGTSGPKSTVETLLVEMSRYFGPRTAAKYPSAKRWKLFRDLKGIKFGKVDSYSKTRFHQIFIIAVQVLMNKNHLIDFTEIYFEDGSVKEFLLTALKDKLILGHLMILAAFELNILGPLWRLAERSPNPAESHEWIHAILKFFDKLKSNPMLIFTDNSPLDQFEGAKTKKLASIAYRGMLEGLEPPTGSSRLSIEIAQVLEEYFRKQFETQLSDTFRDAGDKLRGVPLTNAACESVFSAIDWTYRRAPNMSIGKRSTQAAILKNRLFRLLQSKSKEERQSITEKAKANRPVVERLHKSKTMGHKAELMKDLEEIELERARNHRKIQEKKRKLLENLGAIGIWKSVSELKSAVSKLKPTKAMEAVKNNIRYHKMTSKGKVCDCNLFKFQVSGTKLTSNELISNLSQIIALVSFDDGTDNSDDSDCESSSDQEMIE